MNTSPYPQQDMVSVIIPTFNRVHLLERAINSVLTQTNKNFELIVVDDGSTDNTLSQLPPKFPQVHWITQQNSGVSKARNRGIQQARGQWIALLDSDDVWHPQKLELQVKFIQKTPSILFCHTDEQWIRNGTKVNPPSYLDKTNHQIFIKSLDRCIICPSSVLIHKSILEKTGLFNEELPVCEDYDLWLRLLIGYDIAYLPQKMVTKYGGHNDQLSSQYWGMDRFRVTALENLLNQPNLKEKFKKPIIQTLIQKLDRLAESFAKHNKLKEAEKFRSKSKDYSLHFQSASTPT
jgi:glycosyltransferase involved in cell wall biosynthesis